MRGTVMLLVCGSVLAPGLPNIEVRHKSTVFSQNIQPGNSGRQEGTVLAGPPFRMRRSHNRQSHALYEHKSCSQVLLAKAKACKVCTYNSNSRHVLGKIIISMCCTH